jgi:tetratricopeptide (TPR) repeat protein
MTTMLKLLKGAQTKVTLAVLALLLAVGALYYPGASGPYLFDDGFNLFQNKRLLFDQFSWSALRDAAASGDAGPLRRPIAMASFALNYYFAGNTEPYSLKLTNIALHLITALGIFLLASQLLFHFNKSEPPSDLTRQRWTALFITALWALHPLHVTTVLYAVQRMNGLAGLFTIFSAVVYIKGRERLLRGEIAGLAWAGGAVIIGGTLATLSKESGALLPVLLLAVELTVFRFQTHAAVPPLARRLLIGLLAIPTLAIAGYLIYQTFDAANLYQLRSFNLGERLLTEARVMFLYLQWILLPDIRDMSLFHDDILKSTALFEPIGTGFALAGIAVLVAVALAGLRRAHWRPLSFAILWFLGGHVLESTTIPLELVFEHRNYIPAYGPLFALGYYLTHNPLWATRLRPAFKAVLVIALLALPANELHQRAKHWSTFEDFVLHEAKNHPRSARVMFHLGYSLYVAGAHREALEYLRAATQLGSRETTFAIVALAATYRLREMPDEQLLVQIEQGLKANPMTSYVIQQAADLVDAHNAAASPAYQPITDRIMAAYAQALLDKHVYTSASARAGALYFLAAQSLQQKNETAAIDTLERALAESPPAEDSARIRLGLAKLYLARGELTKSENELRLIDAEMLSASQRAGLAELQKELKRLTTR